MKKGKAKVIILMMALFVLTSSMVVSAQSYANKYVYGDRFSVVVDGTTDNSANFVTVTLTEIRKSDGEPSNYSKVRAKVYDSNNNQISVSNNVEVVKQQTATILLTYMYSSGTQMKLLMKGNNSSLDCIVDFAASISSQ